MVTLSAQFFLKNNLKKGTSLKKGTNKRGIQPNKIIILAYYTMPSDPVLDQLCSPPDLPRETVIPQHPSPPTRKLDLMGFKKEWWAKGPAYMLAKDCQSKGKPIHAALKQWLRDTKQLDEFHFETPHTLITCAFPKDMPIREAYKKLTAMSHKWFSDAKAVMEGHAWGHPHFHLLTLGKADTVQNIVRCFSKRFGVPPNLVDVQKHNSHELYLKRKEEYLKGIKQESKMDKVRMDRDYRAEHGVPDVIELFS